MVQPDQMNVADMERADEELQFLRFETTVCIWRKVVRKGVAQRPHGHWRQVVIVHDAGIFAQRPHFYNLQARATVMSHQNPLFMRVWHWKFLTGKLLQKTENWKDEYKKNEIQNL